MIREAETRDLPSIATLHARAFHAKSEWHRQNFPASLASWWHDKYALEVDDPNDHVLVVPSDTEDSVILGLLSLRRYGADERGAGRWTTFPPPRDLANREAYEHLVQAMMDHRERLMLGRPHLCIQHFGVDSAHQGTGLGASLLGRVCAMADAEGLDVFVEANQYAESFYQRFGFQTEAKLEMPGGMVECLLVRKTNT